MTRTLYTWHVDIKHTSLIQIATSRYHDIWLGSGFAIVTTFTCMATLASITYIIQYSLKGYFLTWDYQANYLRLQCWQRDFPVITWYTLGYDPTLRTHDNLYNIIIRTNDNILWCMVMCSIPYDTGSYLSSEIVSWLHLLRVHHMAHICK